MDHKLSGKVALVTGAGQGIGAAIARELAAQGAKVVVTDLNAETAAATAHAIGETGASAISFQLDVADEAAWGRVVAAAVEALGTIDILVNNAGVIDLTPWSDLSVERFDSIMAVNLKGPFLSAKAVVPVMEQNGGGAIINMSSVNAMAAHHKGLSGYATSKGAIRMFTKALAHDLVDVNGSIPSTPASSSRLGQRRSSTIPRHARWRWGAPR